MVKRWKPRVIVLGKSAGPKVDNLKGDSRTSRISSSSRPKSATNLSLVSLTGLDFNLAVYPGGSAVEKR